MSHSQFIDHRDIYQGKTVEVGSFRGTNSVQSKCYYFLSVKTRAPKSLAAILFGIFDFVSEMK